MNTIFLTGYNPGTHSKSNPFKFEGTHEDFLKIRHHDDLEPTLKDPGSLWIKDYISFKCIDCGKETIAQINTIFTFHRETLRGKRDSIQDDFLCGWCKSKRISQRDYGVDNPNIMRSYVTDARARKEKEALEKEKIKESNKPRPEDANTDDTIFHEKSNPYFWEGSYEDLLKLNYKTKPALQNAEYVSYYCKECGEYTVIKFEQVKNYHNKCVERGTLLPDGLFCRCCKEKKANLEQYGYESYSASPLKRERIWGENGTFWKNGKNIKYQEEPIFLNDWDDYLNFIYSDKQNFVYKCYDCGEEVVISWNGLHSRLRNLSPEDREHLYCHSCSIRHTTRLNYYESEEPYPINKPEDLYSKDFWQRQTCKFTCEKCGKEDIVRITSLKNQYETKGHLYCYSCNQSEGSIESFLNSVIGTSKEPLISKEKLEEFFKKYPKMSLRYYLDKLNEDFKDNEEGQIYRGTFLKYVERYGLEDYVKHCGVSFEEAMMEEFLNSFISKEDIIRRSQKIIPPLELDFYIPNKKYALEFNGNYWHSVDYLNQTRKVADQYHNYGAIYHQNKSLRCLTEQDIKLIHIYEYIWNEKTSIKREDLSNYIKKIILNDENILENLFKKNFSIFNCRKISQDEVKIFIKENSYDKTYNSKDESIGLFLNSDLYAIFCFSGDKKKLCINKFEFKVSAQFSFKFLFDYLIKEYLSEEVLYIYDLDIPLPINLWGIGMSVKNKIRPSCRITNSRYVFTQKEFENHPEFKDNPHFYKVYNAGSLVFSWENDEIEPEEE